MTEPNQPIQLDYKTPEKSERVSAWTIAGRVISGFLGIPGLLTAIGTLGLTIEVLTDRRAFYWADSFVAWIGVVVGGAIFSIMAWFFTIMSIKAAFFGNGNQRKSNIDSNVQPP